MLRNRLLSTLSVMALVPGAALSQGVQQSEPVSLESVMVTATRAPRPVEEVPQSVQIIDRAAIDTQLKLTNSASAALAKLVPGFSVSNQTISGASETFRGRDLLVMVDGVPLTTPLRDVSRMLALIDLNAVDRIEVVAGSSSLYGSGSTGGTVNFITRKAKSGPLNLSAGSTLRAFTENVGSSLAPELSATASGTLEAFDYTVTASGRLADKTYDGKGRELPSDGMLGQGGGDRLAQGNLSAKVGRDLTDSKRFEISGTWIYLDQDPDWLTDYNKPFAKPDFNQPYTGKTVREDTKSLSARYQDVDFGLGELSLVGFYNDVDKRFNYSTVSLYNNFVLYSGNPTNPTSRFNYTELKSERAAINATIDSKLDFIYSGLKLTWGGDVGHEDTRQYYGDGSDAFTPLAQWNYAAFAQFQAPIGARLTLRAGVRYEYFDLSVGDFVRPSVYYLTGGAGGLPPSLVFAPLNVTGGDFTYSSPTFNLGATFKLTATSEFYGGFSQGFALGDIGAYTRRAGLNSAAYLRGGTISYGSIAPDAQIVDNYELGLRGSIGSAFRGSLAGFVSTSDEGVTFSPSTNQLSQQKEIIYGIEATAEYDVTKQLTLGAIFTWREGKYDRNLDGKVDTWLPNNRIATPYRAALSGTYKFDAGTVLRVEEEMWSGRDSFDGTASNRTEAGALTNIMLGHPLWGGQAYFAVNNLLDAAYPVPTATATRNLDAYGWGRTVTIGYQVSF